MTSGRSKYNSPVVNVVQSWLDSSIMSCVLHRTSNKDNVSGSTYRDLILLEPTGEYTFRRTVGHVLYANLCSLLAAPCVSRTTAVHLAEKCSSALWGGYTSQAVPGDILMFPVLAVVMSFGSGQAMYSSVFLRPPMFTPHHAATSNVVVTQIGHSPSNNE